MRRTLARWLHSALRPAAWAALMSHLAWCKLGHFAYRGRWEE